MAIATLDGQSRRSVQEFTIQFCIGCAAVLGPCLIGLRPWTGAGPLLALIFSLNSFMNFGRALLKREQMNGPSLNRWDEAIAFSGCSYLLRAIVQYQS
jgi:hypothetical protein